MSSPLGELHMDNPFREEFSEGDPVRMLSAEFPSIPIETVADIFFSNNGDLRLTFEMLTHLELQEEGGPSPHFAHPPTPPPSLGPLDFPALTDMGGLPPPPHHQGGPLDGPPLMGLGSPRRGAPGAGGDPRGPEHAAMLRKQTQWQFERSRGGPLDPGPPPPPSRRVRGNLLSRPGLGGPGFPGSDLRGVPGERMDFAHGRGPGGGGGGGGGGGPRGPPSPAWLEAGEAEVVSKAREDASAHARARNAFFQQAVKAFQGGNKALARELSAKGRWHNERMQEAHNSASDAIFPPRNPAPGYRDNRGNPPPADGGQVVDLHGLHASEAIALLKRELSGVRAVAGRTGHHQLLFVWVGSGHHAKGRAQPRLAAAVERCLVEEEHLQFSETMPGMLRVIV